MSVFLIAEAIKARLEADTGTGGLWNGASAFKPTGIYFGRGNVSEQAYPYIVISAGVEQNNAMNSDDGDVTYTITVYDAASNGATKLWPIYTRIHGDAVKQAGLTPSYGLDRHQMTLDTNATRNPLAVVGKGCVETGHDFGESDDTPACITLVVRGQTGYSINGA